MLDDLNNELGCGEDLFEAAETFSDVGPMPSHGTGPTDPNGAQLLATAQTDFQEEVFKPLRLTLDLCGF